MHSKPHYYFEVLCNLRIACFQIMSSSWLKFVHIFYFGQTFILCEVYPFCIFCQFFICNVLCCLDLLNLYVASSLNMNWITLFLNCWYTVLVTCIMTIPHTLHFLHHFLHYHIFIQKLFYRLAVHMHSEFRSNNLLAS